MSIVKLTPIEQIVFKQFYKDKLNSFLTFPIKGSYRSGIGKFIGANKEVIHIEDNGNAMKKYFREVKNIDFDKSNVTFLSFQEIKITEK